ncbi:MAG: hypothetical protein IJ220_02215 [Clostridia bacterium]|nr:hypothetical protein [Clostridia bacterium]
MIKHNICFYIFIMIALIALCTDYLMFLFQFHYEISLSISTILAMIVNIFLMKKKRVSIVSNWNTFDILMITFVLIYIICKISIPDFSYDVANYHVYLQQNTVIDKVNFDFFAGKTINAFLFPLGDRMHYIFRYIMGYRLGTLLSYFTLIVIFYEVKKVISLAVNNDKLVSIFALLCTISSTLIRMWSGTYYIDTFSIPILLEIIYILFKAKQSEESIALNQMIYLALLAGIATGIKVLNLILILPIFAFFIFKIKPQFNSKVLIPMIVFLFPWILYAIDNHIQTGSMLFPYYNNFFQSPYFGDFSWKDARFGIPNVVYALIWPVYTSVVSLGYGDEWYIREPIWAVGYVYTIVYLIYAIIKRQKNTVQYDIAIISIILTVFWLVLLEGYMRYALIIPVLYSITISITLIHLMEKVFQKDKHKIHIRLTHKKIKYVLSIISFTCIIISVLLLSDEAKENYPLVLNDRNCEKIEIDGVWGTIADDVVLTELVREKNTPIYNLDKSTIDTSNLTLKMYYEIIKSEKPIYVLVDLWNYEEKIGQLLENHFELDELVETYQSEQIPFLNKYDELYLYKVAYKGEIPNEK